MAGPLLVIYLLTATWSYPGYNDAFTNSVVGWGIGTHGSPYLEEHTDLVGTNWPGWIVPAGDSASGNYPPGAALLAAPVYANWSEEAETITAPEQQFGSSGPETEHRRSSPCIPWDRPPLPRLPRRRLLWRFRHSGFAGSEAPE